MGVDLLVKVKSSFIYIKLDYMSTATCLFSEFLGAAVLAFMIVAATDKNNAAPPIGLLPFVLFLTLLGLGAALGMQTGTWGLVFILRYYFNSESGSLRLQPRTRFRTAIIFNDGGIWERIVYV